MLRQTVKVFLRTKRLAEGSEKQFEMLRRRRATWISRRRTALLFWMISNYDATSTLMIGSLLIGGSASRVALGSYRGSASPFRAPPAVWSDVEQLIRETRAAPPAELRFLQLRARDERCCWRAGAFIETVGC